MLPITATTRTNRVLGLAQAFGDVARPSIANIDSLQISAIAADDAIGYIAVNPAQPDEIVFATFGRDIYSSIDGGQAWRPIAQDGRGE